MKGSRHKTQGEVTESLIRAHQDLRDKSYFNQRPVMPEKPPPQVVDKKGRPQKLTPYQRNGLYKRATYLRQQIQDGMLTYQQCWQPTEKDIDNMERREHTMDDMKIEYKKCMQAIGAGPKECSTETYRRKE